MGVRNIADYQKAKAVKNAAFAELVKKAEAGKWSMEEFVPKNIDVLFPFYKIENDPFNPPDVLALLRADALQGLKKESAAGRELSRKDAPELYAFIDKQVAELNRIYKINYSSPIVVAISFASKEKQPKFPPGFNAKGNMILIDARDIETARDNQAFNAVITHELTHPYLMNDTIVKAMLTHDQYSRANLTTPKETLKTLRNMESEADFRSAQLVSPVAAMDKDMNADTVNKLAISQLIREQLKLSDTDDVTTHFQRLSSKEQQALQDAFSNLPIQSVNELLIKALKVDARFEALFDHPTNLSRLELMQAFIDNPELLKATRIQFDGSANITELETPSHRYTPNELRDINQKADDVIGQRKP